ncbi:blue copper protein 1a-like [Tripterygium wilfordii]|uniref:blue copper protein 1a-like n=1 Tax=Tripterygium wilfordii TaxID=458696 RepID=UPI0018F832ED|nr:blue copper protein 1a-like [Tripterygium wilfordii]
MVSSRVLVVFSIVAAIVSTTLAKEFIVGDEVGWIKGYNYNTWAKNKDFRVGDTLVFKYLAGSHNVWKVNGSTEFKDCKTPPPPNKALTTGNDIITLATSGVKWYICGFPEHCEYGQKLAIFVRPQAALPPSYMAPALAPTQESETLEQESMASSRVLLIFSLVAALVSTTTLAKEFTVGDEAGWTNGFDYQKWAQGKDFMVGDTLVFNYAVGDHNVFKVVNGTLFQNCVKPPANEALTTGKDQIVLGSPGKKWYICGVEKHCAEGQKLAIEVMGSMGPAPSPNSGVKASISKLSMMIIFAMVSLVMIMV